MLSRNFKLKIESFLFLFLSISLVQSNKNNNNNLSKLTMSRKIIKTAQEKANFDILIFNYFLNLTNIFTLEEIAMALNMTPSRVEKIILCYGGQIHSVKISKLIKINDIWKIAYTIILSVLIFLSIIGNLSSIIFLNPFKLKLKCKKRASIKVIDIFFWNSSIFDLFWSILVTSCQIILVLNNGFWTFNSVFCKFYGYFTYLILTVNSLTILALAFDRYCIVMINQQESESQQGFNKFLASLKCSKAKNFKNGVNSISKKTYIWLVGMIIFSFFLNIPYYKFSEKYFVIEGNTCLDISDNFICMNKWKDSKTENAYKILAMNFNFIIPGVLITYFYFKISIFLFRKKKIGDGHGILYRIKHRERIIKILLIDCIFYVFCWYPFSIWIIVTCISDLFDLELFSFESSIFFFTLFYIGPITNVSLKWIFRFLGIYKKFKINIL